MEVDPEIACGIVGNIGQLWLTEQFTDLQINIDDFQFYCNRFVLCACSEFFHVLLQSEIKDEAARHVTKVNIKGISPGIFQLVLNAIYKGENGLNTENILEFWHAVHELQIPVLVSKCETFFSSHMTRENVLGIYTSALLLESEKIVKMVHEFMAKNFEYFSTCQVFMLLSPQGLQEILSDRNLKVDKHDNLPQSILKWVNHEPDGNNVGQSCEGDILEVRDTNIVSDQMSDNSTDVSNGHKGSVEVILQKPPASSQDSCLQIVAHFHTQTTARKESLGSLLKLCRLSEASRDCLDMLADTDMIMGVKETRDVVKQALEAHSKAQESAKNKVLPTNSVAADDGLSVKTEDVVVFQKGGNMYAYSLDRNKFFRFMSHMSVVNCYTLNNCIFVTTKTCHRQKITMYMTVCKFPFSENSTTVINDVGSCSAIVNGFYYTFKDKGVYRKRCDFNANYCDWFQVIDFKREISCVLVNIFKDNIIFYDTESLNNTIYCFNTTIHRVWDMPIGGLRNFVTINHNDQLYVLSKDGYLWNVTTCVNLTDVCHASVTDGRLQSMYHQIWSGSCDLTGAIIRGDTLVIFADLINCKTPVVTLKPHLHSVLNIHFVHLHTEDKCYPLTVPPTMLITEV